MKKTTLLLSVIVGLLVTFSCNKKSDELHNLYKFREYIAYHTTGRISKADPIQIQLNKPTEKFELTQELPSDFISISPQVKGKLILENQQTLYFIPDAYLNPNTEYTLTLQLDKLWDDIDKEFRKFTFSFQTLEHNFKIHVQDLKY